MRTLVKGKVSQSIVSKDLQFEMKLKRWPGDLRDEKKIRKQENMDLGDVNPCPDLKELQTDILTKDVLWILLKRKLSLLIYFTRKSVNQKKNQVQRRNHT